MLATAGVFGPDPPLDELLPLHPTKSAAIERQSKAPIRQPDEWYLRADCWPAIALRLTDDLLDSGPPKYSCQLTVCVTFADVLVLKLMSPE